MSNKKRAPLRRKTSLKYIVARRVVPKDTYYCYTPTEWAEDRMSYKVKICPYYKFDKESTLIGHCKLMGGEIWDMCKNCGINEGF